AGEAQLAGMAPAVRSQLAAFARGVTDGARLGCTAKAHELALLLAEPTPWEAADVVGGAAFVAFALASNWAIELARLRLLQEGGPARADAGGGRAGRARRARPRVPRVAPGLEARRRRRGPRREPARGGSRRVPGDDRRRLEQLGARAFAHEEREAAPRVRSAPA